MYRPGISAIASLLSGTQLSLRLNRFDPYTRTLLRCCQGSPEGRFTDPGTSLRFDIVNYRLYFKTTAEGISTGWVLIGGGGGSAPSWDQVLANGNHTGANNPIVDVGQSLFIGNVPLTQGLAGQLAIDGNVIPIGAHTLGVDATRWLQGFIDHLNVSYAEPPSGTTLSTETFVNVVAGTYDLPTASQSGSLYFVRNEGPGATTINAGVGDTINGAASLNLPAGSTAMLVADGANNWVSTTFGGSTSTVTLQAALDGQNGLGIPTTQAYTTTIDIGDNQSWIWADQGNVPIVTLSGDGPAAALTVQGGSTSPAGAGQAISMTGGAATAATQNGGNISLAGGTGNTTGTGGNASLTSGAGGATGTGGTTSVVGGAGGATSGNGGQVVVQGGLPVDGNGGAAVLAGRAGVGTNRSGGQVIVSAGAATGSGVGGNLSVSAGAGGATGTAGAIAITSGAAGSVSGASGAITISTPPSVLGATGSITLTTGNATGGVAGNIVARGGTGTTNGRMIVQPVWAGDAQAFAIVGNGGNSATAGLHAGSRDPNTAVSSNPGSLYMRNPGAGTAGALFVNTSIADPGTDWVQVATANDVTLQRAITNQSTTPTTQGFTTHITLNDTFGWSFEDQGGVPIVAINGDGGATAVAITGGNTSPAGAGQAITVTGGAATTAAQNGGAVTVTSGAGNTSGTGGLLSVIAGAGGATGVGGTVLIRGGAGGATSGNASGVTIQGGTPVDGNGGAIAIAASAGVGTNRSGGGIVVTAGAATGNAAGGSISVTAGAGGATGTAGALALQGGAAGSVSGASGAVTINTQPSTSGATGSITLTTGNATGGVAGDIVARGGTGTTNGRMIVQPVWAGDAQAFAIVGNGANSATAGLHTSSRVGGPNGAVSGNPGSLLMWNPGVASPGTAYVNVSTTDPGTLWAELINANTAVLAGMPGNIYENLVGYVDSADRNSYSGSGTTVTDIFRNLTTGTLTSSTFDDGAWTWNGTTGALTFVKNANIDNLFTGGGTVIAFIRPVNGGENNGGRIVDTTDSLDEGWLLSVNAPTASRVGLTFQRNFNGGAANAGQWATANVTDPWTGTSVLAVEEGSWSSVAVTYDDGNVANDPIFYVNGALVGTTEVVTPVGTAVSDVGNGLLVANRTADDSTFNGSISIVLLFDRILSLSEITDVYNLFGRRYGLGQVGFPATVGLGQDVSLVGGPTATATVRGGNVQVAGGESSAAGATSNGGDVIVRGGNLTGVNNGRSGNLICLAGSVTNTSSSATSGSAEFGAGVHNNGNAAGLCTIHGGDNSASGAPGNMIVRGGDCITATATADGGASLGMRAGNARTAAASPGSTFIAGGGFLSGTAGTTGDITISTQRGTLGPFPATGGTSTSTGSISILTTGPGATAGTTGDITIRCGDTNAVTGNNPGDILIQAGASASTTQASVTAGSVSLVGGANAGVGASVGGGISLTGGASTNTGATTGTGGDITLTGGAMAHNSAASRGGNISGTAGAATGTNGSGGSVTWVGGASTGTGTPGSVAITAGNAAGAIAGGTASVNGGIGGATGNGGVVNINGGNGGATSGAGGQVNINGGSATDGLGGAVIITGANGAGTNRAGGAVRVIAGNGIGTAGGGGAALTAGNGGATGAGGDATITSGNGGATSGASGNIVVLAGTVTSGTSGEFRYTQGAGTRTATTSFRADNTQTFQTTDATPFVVTIHTLTADGRNVGFRFKIRGQQGTTANFISATFEQSAFRSGGTVTLNAQESGGTNGTGFAVNPTIVLSASGNDVIATITGIAATTINWSCYWDKQEGGA